MAEITHWEGCWRQHHECAVKRVEALETMLNRMLDSREAEARATLACEVAMDNYSDPKPNMDAMQDAMVAASLIEKEARALLEKP